MSTRGTTKIKDVYIVADSRERAVIPFIEDSYTEYAYIVKQITTGDFNICQLGKDGTDPKIVACFERKTLKDFADSFKDGRFENLQKMKALRSTTGCALYFIVEGPAFPSPKKRFNRIPYANILAAMTSLMGRDGVFIVQTKDESDTAKRLEDFMRMYDQKGTDGYTPPAELKEEDDAAAAAEAATGGDETKDQVAQPLQLIIPDVLTARVEETDSHAAVAMWSRLRGISVVLGKILTREFTVAELVSQQVSPDQIKALKTATGRKINKDAVASLLAVRSNSLEHAVKLVSGLRNITPAVATLILQSCGGLARLCDSPIIFIAGVQIPQKNRTIKFGTKRAERVRHMIYWKEGGTPPPELVGHRLDEPAPEPVDVVNLANLALEGVKPDVIINVPDEDIDAILAASGFG